MHNCEWKQTCSGIFFTGYHCTVPRSTVWQRNLLKILKYYKILKRFISLDRSIKTNQPVKCKMTTLKTSLSKPVPWTDLVSVGMKHENVTDIFQFSIIFFVIIENETDLKTTKALVTHLICYTWDRSAHKTSVFHTVQTTKHPLLLQFTKFLFTPIINQFTLGP